MKKPHLAYLRKAVALASGIKGSAFLTEMIGKLRGAKLPVYQMIRDIVCDSRFYCVLENDLFWKNYAVAVISHFIDSLTAEDWNNEEQRTEKKEDFLNAWLSKHIFPLTIKEKKDIVRSMNLTAGDSNRPIIIEDGDEGISFSNDYIESGITDETNNAGEMGYSLPEEIQQYAQASQGCGPGAKTGSHQADADYLGRIHPSIVELAKKIGRSGSSFKENSGRFQSASRSDISGITSGNDLNSLLPSELALLGTPKTENIFYRRYVERQLQLFSSASHSFKDSKQKSGPIYICIDTSGSMSGEPEVMAKTLSLAIAIVAQRDRRPICIINYSFDLSFFILSDLTRQRNMLMKFLSHSYDGGNDENKLFHFIFKKLATTPEYKSFADSFRGADMLIISDFIWSYISKENLRFIDEARNAGMKLYGVCVFTESDMHPMPGFQDDEDDQFLDGYGFLRQCDYSYQYRNGVVSEYLSEPFRK